MTPTEIRTCSQYVSPVAKGLCYLFSVIQMRPVKRPLGEIGQVTRTARGESPLVPWGWLHLHELSPSFTQRRGIGSCACRALEWGPLVYFCCFHGPPGANVLMKGFYSWTWLSQVSERHCVGQYTGWFLTELIIMTVCKPRAWVLPTSDCISRASSRLLSVGFPMLK